MKKMTKIKKLMFDLMGIVSNNVLNLVLEYYVLAQLNAKNVGEDRRFLDDDSVNLVSRTIRSDDPYNIYGLGD